MPNVEFRATPPVEAKKFPPGMGIVISVGLAGLAVGVALNLWLGENVGNPKIWFFASMAVAVLTICLAAFSFYRDREEAEYDEYIEKLRAIVKITHVFKAD